MRAQLRAEFSNLRADVSDLRMDMGNMGRAIDSQFAQVRQTMAVNLEAVLAAIAGKA